ncbi:MAG: hypothetical protein ACR2MG_19525 [Pyrinomonadaceae bacterium]
MKKPTSKICLGRESKLNLPIVLLIFIFIGLGCSNLIPKNNKENVDVKTPEREKTTPTPRTVTKKADASKGEIPSDDELQEMAKTTLLDFNDAIQKEDFSDFYSNISAAWQKQVTPEKLKGTFKPFIDKKVNIENIDSRDAEFTDTPVIEKELGYKTLKLKGRYETSPLPTKFELNYILEKKEWKLSKIVVDTTPDKN